MCAPLSVKRLLVQVVRYFDPLCVLCVLGVSALMEFRLLHRRDAEVAEITQSKTSYRQNSRRNYLRFFFKNSSIRLLANAAASGLYTLGRV